MRLDNSFGVPASPDAAWELLMDVPRVVPCMPGATLVETVSDTEWKALLAAKLGPIELLFDTDVRREEVDELNRVVTLSARARDKRGQADARIRSALVEGDGETRVEIQTDLTLSGAIARFGRASVVRDMAAQLTADFATALRAELAPTPASVGSVDAAVPDGDGSGVPDPPRAPLSAARLICATLRRIIARRLRRRAPRG
jgi:carbon monoxide dehydrogenase subunit G